MNKILKKLVIVAIYFCIVQQSATANTITFSESFEVTNSRGYSEFVIGDIFHISFNMDDTATSSNQFFSNAMMSFSVTSDSGNIGTWDPSSGTIAFSPFKNVNLNMSDNLTVQANGSGFPSMNGNAFSDFDVWADFSGVYNFTNPGSLAPLSTWVGVSPLDFLQANIIGLRIRDDTYNSPDFLHIVPEPGTLVFFALSSMLVIATRRKNVG